MGNGNDAKRHMIEQRRPLMTARSWEDTLPYIRYTFLGGAILYLAFWGWDEIIDPAHAADTLPLRLGTTALYGVLFALFTWRPGVRPWTVPAYVGGILAAPVSMTLLGLQLDHGYVMINGGLIIAILAMAFIGPDGRTSVPLVMVAATLPSILVFAAIGGGLHAPGLPDPVTTACLGMLQLGAAMIAIILARVDTLRERALFDEHWSLRRLATTDPLTGVANRRRFETEFAREASRHQRHGRIMALLMIDLDHFKDINDTHGHGVGDEVLCGVVARWTDCLRVVDHLCRFGGEEFAVLLPETSAAEARTVAERLRAALATPLETSHGPVRVTVSIGIAVVPPEAAAFAQAVGQADAALYRAKEAGRDRVMTATPASVANPPQKPTRRRVASAA